MLGVFMSVALTLTHTSPISMCIRSMTGLLIAPRSASAVPDPAAWLPLVICHKGPGCNGRLIRGGGRGSDWQCWVCLYWVRDPDSNTYIGNFHVHTVHDRLVDSAKVGVRGASAGGLVALGNLS
jgi:hypothetical protein